MRITSKIIATIIILAFVYLTLYTVYKTGYGNAKKETWMEIVNIDRAAKNGNAKAAILIESIKQYSNELRSGPIKEAASYIK